MNILTFDIEEWYLQKVYLGDHADAYKKYDYFLNQILDTLDDRGIKGTFFCVGGMGIEFPDVLKKIDERGNEIGCHSFNHIWLNKMTEKEAYEDTRMAIDSLEQCIGKKVTSYRAPAFSIGMENKWMLEILAKCGITRDASVFPISRDFGGFPNYDISKPSIIKINGFIMKEFPICTTKILGHQQAYSGGGYFRSFPSWFIKKEITRNEYNMCYFHIGDFIPRRGGLMSRQKFEEYYKIPGTMKNRCLRYFKTNIGKKRAFLKFEELIRSFHFVNLQEADHIIDWKETPVVTLDVDNTE